MKGNNWILHVDGDSFFASVETSLNPALKNKPVVTGHERGIATSMSKEAKALGVHRGMPVYKIRKQFPQVVIAKSDYHHYGIFAQRMYNIVRRYADRVEEYSIDECFALVKSVEDAHAAKHDLQKELGLTFSIGLAPTKVLAKVASKWNKPDGFTVLTKEGIPDFLRDLAVGKVWGIGPATSLALQRKGIKTALELVEQPWEWIEHHLHKHERELWFELRGEQVYKVHDDTDEAQASIQQTRTFSPRPNNDKNFLLSELSKNVEGACSKARAQGLAAWRVHYFLKTQTFRYHRRELVLNEPLQTPSEILNIIRATINDIYIPNVDYRATGVTLAGLVPEGALQNDLFGEVVKKENSREIFKVVDTIEKRFGEHAVVLGSSMRALKGRKVRPGHDERRFQIPFMGEVV